VSVRQASAPGRPSEGQAGMMHEFFTRPRVKKIRVHTGVPPEHRHKGLSSAGTVKG
jgi:hypothetical protein